MPTKTQLEQSRKHRENRTAQCSKCREVKSWDDFSPCVGRRPFGLSSNCIPCDRARKAKQKRDEYARLEDKTTRNKRDALKKNFGLTLEEYEQMLEDQDHKCAICKKPEDVIHPATGKLQRMTVDHCHKTQRVRALLCSRCNMALGLFFENIGILENAIKYVKEKCQ